MPSVEEFIVFEVLLGIIVSLVVFLTFYNSFSSIFPVGCDSNSNVLENQFTQAEYGLPNRLEGTPLFRCYNENACYRQSTAYNTCVTHWCYYTLWKNGQGSYSQVQSCISDPSAYPVVADNCKSISTANTAALESCSRSTIIADNSTTIENCDINVPSCLPGDGPQCPPCQGQ